jgi:hypothetical protein
MIIIGMACLMALGYKSGAALEIDSKRVNAPATLLNIQVEEYLPVAMEDVPMATPTEEKPALIAPSDPENNVQNPTQLAGQANQVLQPLPTPTPELKPVIAPRPKPASAARPTNSATTKHKSKPSTNSSNSPEEMSAWGEKDEGWR